VTDSGSRTVRQGRVILRAMWVWGVQSTGLCGGGKEGRKDGRGGKVRDVCGWVLVDRQCVRLLRLQRECGIRRYSLAISADARVRTRKFFFGIGLGG
jgi:hypothetical protein